MNKKEFIKNFGLTIRKVRQDKNITLEELAYKCGISYTMLSNLQRGVSNDLKLSSILYIINCLHIDGASLFDKMNKKKISLVSRINDLSNEDIEYFEKILNKLSLGKRD